MKRFSVAQVVFALTLSLCSVIHGKRYCTVNQVFSSGTLTPRGSVYRIYVITKTASGSWTGTNANVDIKLVGQHGTTDWYRLQNSRGGYFQPEEYDEFYLNIASASSIGTVQCIELRHDNTGSYPGWFPEYVVVAEVPPSAELIHCFRSKDLGSWTSWLCPGLPGNYQYYVVNDWITTV